MKCSRTACQVALTEKRGFYKIWNEPSTVKGYREYCFRCGSRIMEFNVRLPKDQHMKHEVIYPRRKTDV